MVNKLKQIHLSAQEILKKSKKDQGSYYLEVFPQVVEEIEEKYHDYLLPVEIRVRALEKKMNELERLKKELEQKISIIEKHKMYPKKIDNISAEKQIIELLKEYKIKGKTKINITRIASSLNLPIDQVDDILDKLESEGIISDV